MLVRLGERRRLWEISRKTHIVRKLGGNSFHGSVPHFKRSSRRSWSVTFRCLLVCVSMPVVCMSPRESIDDADCELFRL